MLTNRIRSARRAGDAGAVLALTRQLGEFERILQGQIAQFSYTSGLRERWRDRFSEPSLENVVRDVGAIQLEEYDREYLMGCMYAHGAPSAVLFPLATSTDFEAERRQSIARTSLTGALAIEVMSRVYRRQLASRAMEGDDYLRELSERTHGHSLRKMVGRAGLEPVTTN